MGVERLWLSTYTPKCSAFQGEWKMDLWIETGGRKSRSDAVYVYRHNGCQLIWWKNSLNEDNFLQSWLLKIHYYSNPILELIHANLEIKIEAQGVTDRSWIICLGFRLDLLFRLVVAWIAVVLLVKTRSFATVKDLWDSSWSGEAAGGFIPSWPLWTWLCPSVCLICSPTIEQNFTSAPRISLNKHPAWS